jgi:hypothetical protein
MVRRTACSLEAAASRVMCAWRGGQDWSETGWDARAQAGSGRREKNKVVR